MDEFENFAYESKKLFDVKSDYLEKVYKIDAEI